LARVRRSGSSIRCSLGPKGTPCFTEEHAAAAAAGSEALPASLRDMLLARIDGLGQRARDVVGLVATGGLRMHHRLLSAVVSLDEPTLTTAGARRRTTPRARRRR
jgi:hypothetical protein